MKVLVIGNGGREHALAWKAAQSPLVDTVFVAPGNAGTALEPALQNVAIGVTDIPALLSFAQNEKIDLTIVGPEAPLVIGVVDAFRAAGNRIFGPTAAAAQLESLYAYADWTRRQAFPQSAAAEQLEHHAGLWGLSRTAARHAAGTLRLYVPQALSTAVTVAAGSVFAAANGVRYELQFS